MKKKILISSILILPMILLMPSIPAIHMNAMENVLQDNINETKLNYDIIYIKKLSDLPDHILLFLIFYTIAKFRYMRFELNFAFSIATQYFKFVHPLLLSRSIFLLFRYSRWVKFWDVITETFGWNWAV